MEEETKTIKLIPHRRINRVQIDFSSQPYYTKKIRSDLCLA